MIDSFQMLREVAKTDYVKCQFHILTVSDPLYDSLSHPHTMTNVELNMQSARAVTK